MPKTRITSTRTVKSGKKRITPSKTRARATNGNRAPQPTNGSGNRVSGKPRKSVQPDTDGENFITIQLRTQANAPIVFKSSRELQRAAMQWSYVLCNRRRWNTSEFSREQQAVRAFEELQKIGITKDQLRYLAGCGIVEVNIPYTTEKEGWEARIFPWEYMLTAGTRTFRDGKPLTVIRHLERKKPAAKSPKNKFSRVLIVESAPGDLRSNYKFDSERNLVKSGLALKETEVSVDETRDQLRDHIADYSPDVVHVAGFDNNQAAAMGVIRTSSVYDGYLLKGVDGNDPVKADDLAPILNSAKQNPSLICFNIFFSAARICASAVAAGAGAAIGFQDEFEDALSELFFTNFYEAWRRFNWDTLEAFNFACDALKKQSATLTGTGVVLWSDRSLIKQETAATRTIKTTLLSDKEKVLTLADSPDQDARKLFSIEIKSCPNLNYSMLHNNCELFETFVLRKEKTGRVKDIRVQVSLYVGGQSSHFSCAVDMVESPLDLNKIIRVPLLYSTELLNNENIHTGLYVEVSWENQLLHRQTYRVTLPPLDEWRGNDRERVWLPSFVLPRDRAVSRIVDTAQNFVMALRDNSAAGFDGYQCINPNDDESVKGVDEQVQALWSALIYNYSLSYINPPPTYNLSAQRLRIPTEIIEGRRGTCIDLALLFAACLEYIDIYPVIFLLKNHALPGFWRRPSFQDDFRKVAERSQKTPTGAEPSQLSTVQEWPWYFSKNAYEEIMEEIDLDNQRLFPIETVGLTQRAGFKDSILSAIDKLKNEKGIAEFEFEGMIDITQARGNSITPIPRR